MKDEGLALILNPRSCGIDARAPDFSIDCEAWARVLGCFIDRQIFMLTSFTW